MTHHPNHLAAELLATPESEWPGWLDAHASDLTLAVIEALKQQSDSLNRTDTDAAERITRAALAVAERLPHVPLAMPLACWARGNWAVYIDAREAAECYQTALPAYDRAGDITAVARLTSNLVFAYTTLGRYEDALAAAERARLLLLASGEAAERYLVNLGVNYGLLLYECGRYDEALAANDVTMALALRHDMTEAWVETRINQAFTLAMVGRMEECEQLLHDSRARLERMSPPPLLTIARVDLNLGDYYSVMGRPAEALPYFRCALDAFAKQHVAMDYASVILYEAALLERLGAFRAACRAYDRAHDVFTEHGMSQYAAQASLAGATVRRAMNPEDSKIPTMLASALARFTELNLPVWRAETLLEQAHLALARGDLAQAETVLATEWSADAPPYLVTRWHVLRGRLALARGDERAAQVAFQEALAGSRAAAHIWLQREALAELGACLARHSPESARRHLAEAASIDEYMRATLSVEELTADFQARRGDVLPLLVRLEAEAGQAWQALHTAWRWKVGALIDLLARRAGVSVMPFNRELAELQRHIAILRWEAERKVQDGEAEEKVAGIRDQVHRLEAQAYEMRRHLMQQSAAGAFQRIGDPQETLRRMDADLLIEYVQCGHDLLAFCADGNGGCTTTWLGSVATIGELLGRLETKNVNVLRLNAEQRQAQSAPQIRAVQSILRRLYDALIAPLPGLPAGGKILIAPCAPLHLVPFAALWDGARYLVETYVLEQIPGGALLGVPAPVGETGPPLAIGASAEGALGAVRQEIAAVAAALPDCRTYVDDPAALDALTTLDRAPRILHLSAHTAFDEEPTIFAGLHLTGSVFTIEQCYRLNLAGTELAVLNGCTTALGMESGGALIAFQSALLIAGARRLLVSLWQLKDDVTAAAMTHFYRYLTAGDAPPEALRAAQLAMLRDPALAHPAVWSAFALIRR